MLSFGNVLVKMAAILTSGHVNIVRIFLEWCHSILHDPTLIMNIKSVVSKLC